MARLRLDRQSIGDGLRYHDLMGRGGIVMYMTCQLLAWTPE